MNRPKDLKDLEVFTNIVHRLLESIKHAEFTLRNADCEEPQFDDFNSIMEFKRVVHAFVKRVTGKPNPGIHDLPPEAYDSIREPYVGTMTNFANGILKLGNKCFILLSYDIHRFETGVNIIDEYYDMMKAPKIKVSFNSNMSKNDILKSYNKSDEDSDKINNQKGLKKE